MQWSFNRCAVLPMLVFLSKHDWPSENCRLSSNSAILSPDLGFNQLVLFQLAQGLYFYLKLIDHRPH